MSAAAFVLIGLTPGVACDSSSDGTTASPGADALSDAGDPVSDSGAFPQDATDAGADLTAPGEDIAPDVPPPLPGELISAKHRTLRVDLGEHALGDYGHTEAVTFDIDARVETFTILVEGHPDVEYIVSELTDPEGTRLVPAGWELYGDPTLCTACENRVCASEETAAFMVPSTPEVEILPGTYTLVVRGFQIVEDPPGVYSVRSSHEPVRLSLLFREPLPADRTGLVDLNLFFTGARGITAATALTQPIVQDIVDRVDSIYSQVAVGVGDVTYSDAPREYQIIETVSGADSDLSELFRLSSDSPDGMNLYFVESILAGAGGDGGYGMVLGIAGGIPGPPLYQGTARSGALVVLELPVEQPAMLAGTVAAHEMGHYLGLYHTAEQYIPGYGQVYDQIEDTPRNDARNLMYYSSIAPEPVLSEGQGAIVRSNPLVYDPAWVE